jgi:predicted TIM-barrel enzyme
MSHRTFANELEAAADGLADINCGELQALLRRAALRLRNTGRLTLDADVDEAIDLLAAELKQQQPDVLRTIVRDWLIIAGRLPGNPADGENLSA